MADPLVTIVIPTYNRADLLAETLDSVSAQTFRDYEIIVVDDGSTDHTAQMIARRSEPIRYFRQRNEGASSARNHGLREARGSLVAFLDSDDLWLPEYLQACVELLRQRDELAMVYCDFTCIGETGQPVNGHRKVQHDGDVVERLFASTFVHTSCVTARKSVVLDAAGFDESLPTNEDYDLWLRLALQYPFGLVSRVLCKRRTHRCSLSRNGRSGNLLRKTALLEDFYHRYGDGRIGRRIAHRRLGKVHYSAGKSLLKDGCFHQARYLLQRSLHYRSIAPKTWALFLLSATLAFADRSGNGSSRSSRVALYGPKSKQ
ncbi:MAG TPA: glycosyltransferase family A protein [Phycisphaerae bacterium]|nr:glycosyltransferase family A protein [Phycisphaerae bacterium]